MATSKKSSTTKLDIQKEKDFQILWNNSKMGRELLANSIAKTDYTGPDFLASWAFRNIRNDNIQNAPVNFLKHTSDKYKELSTKSSQPNTVGGWYEHPGKDTPYGNIVVNDRAGYEQGLQHIYHELSHAADEGGWYIPKSDIDLMQSFSNPFLNKNEKASNINFLKYVANPTETRARLQNFRRNALDQGVYNPFNQKATLESLQKYKPSNTGFDPLQQLRDVYTNPQIIEMLNTISKRNAPKQSNLGYALNGAVVDNDPMQIRQNPFASLIPANQTQQFDFGMFDSLGLTQPDQPIEAPQSNFAEAQTSTEGDIPTNAVEGLTAFGKSGSAAEKAGNVTSKQDSNKNGFGDLAKAGARAAIDFTTLFGTAINSQKQNEQEKMRMRDLMQPVSEVNAQRYGSNDNQMYFGNGGDVESEPFSKVHKDILEGKYVQPTESTNNSGFMLPEVTIMSKRINPFTLNSDNQLIAQNRRDLVLQNQRRRTYPYETPDTYTMRTQGSDMVLQGADNMLSLLHPLGTVINGLANSFDMQDATTKSFDLKGLPKKSFVRLLGNNLSKLGAGLDFEESKNKYNVGNELLRKADSIDLSRQYKNGGLPRYKDGTGKGKIVPKVVPNVYTITASDAQRRPFQADVTAPVAPIKVNGKTMGTPIDPRIYEKNTLGMLGVGATALAAPVVLPAIGSAMGTALAAPLTVGSSTFPLITGGNLLGAGFGLKGANALANQYNTNYYSSDAPLVDKVSTGLQTGLDITGTPGMFSALNNLGRIQGMGAKAIVNGVDDFMKIGTRNVINGIAKGIEPVINRVGLAYDALRGQPIFKGIGKRVIHHEALNSQNNSLNQNFIQNIVNGNQTGDINSIRRAYHNSERFLMPHEVELLNQHGHGNASDYTNQLPAPPEFINISNILNQNEIRRAALQDLNNSIVQTQRSRIGYNANPFPINSQAWVQRNDELALLQNRINQQQRIFGSGNSNKTAVNKSGFNRNNALIKGKNKDFINKLTDTEFENTVLKPNGDVENYYDGSIDEYFSGENALDLISNDEYMNLFNSNLDELNNIINKNNTSGVQYKVKGINNNGIIKFETPRQVLPDGSTLPEGTSIFSTRILPARWNGTVQDINNTRYLRRIPGLEMSNTSLGVFPDGMARRGTKTYESLNEYLKLMGLGRVKAGFNSQTKHSLGAWENLVNSGKGVGFYSEPDVVYATMKSILPYVGTGFLGYQGLKQNSKDNQITKRNGGTLPRYANGTDGSETEYDYRSSIKPFYTDAEDKRRYQEALTRLYYSELQGSPSVEPYLAKDRNKIFDAAHNRQVSNDFMTCIDGVCGIMEKAGKFWNSGNVNQHYIGNETFYDQAYGSYDNKTGIRKYPTEDVYAATGNFQVGDIVQAMSPKNGRNHPYDAKVIVAVEDGPNGKIFHTRGGGGGSTIGGSSYTEEELLNYIKNQERVITRPGYFLDKDKLEQGRITGPEALKAIQERNARLDFESNEGNIPWRYELQPNSPYAGTDNAVINSFMNFANDKSQVERFAKKFKVSTRDIHDELLNVFGELGQESKFGKSIHPELLIERITPGFIRKNLSIGPGQIRFSSLSKEIKDYAGIKKPKDLYDEDKVVKAMTAINIQNRKYLKGKGTELTNDLMGTPGYDWTQLSERLGRYTPYMYQSPAITGPKDYAKRKLRADKFFDPSQEEIDAYYNSNPQYFQRVLDPESYAGKVYDWTNKNLSRSTPTFWGPQQLQETVIKEKRIKKNGGNFNSYSNGGIMIKPENRGKFTAFANSRDMGVQEAAQYVLNNREDFTPMRVKQANFAHNAASWKKANGGFNGEEIKRAWKSDGTPVDISYVTSEPSQWQIKDGMWTRPRTNTPSGNTIGNMQMSYYDSPAPINTNHDWQVVDGMWSRPKGESKPYFDRSMKMDRLDPMKIKFNNPNDAYLDNLKATPLNSFNPMPVDTNTQYGSIVDLLKSQGKGSSFNERQNMAKTYGIKNYTGTADQNIQLMKMMNTNRKNGGNSCPECMLAEMLQQYRRGGQKRQPMLLGDLDALTEEQMMNGPVNGFIGNIIPEQMDSLPMMPIQQLPVLQQSENMVPMANTQMQPTPLPFRLPPLGPVAPTQPIYFTGLEENPTIADIEYKPLLPYPPVPITRNRRDTRVLDRDIQFNKLLSNMMSYSSGKDNFSNPRGTMQYYDDKDNKISNKQARKLYNEGKNTSRNFKNNKLWHEQVKRAIEIMSLFGVYPELYDGDNRRSNKQNGGYVELPRFANGGSIPKVTGLPPGHPAANAIVESGEAIQFGDGQLARVAPEGPYVEDHGDANDGTYLPNVQRVLEDTSAKAGRNKKSDKLLALNGSDLNEMFGMKGMDFKGKYSHASAFDKVTSAYDKARERYLNKNTSLAGKANLSDTQRKAMELNEMHAMMLPEKEDIFEMLFQHQEGVKQEHGISDSGKNDGLPKGLYGLDGDETTPTPIITNPNATPAPIAGGSLFMNNIMGNYPLTEAPTSQAPIAAGPQSNGSLSSEDQLLKRGNEMAEALNNQAAINANQPIPMEWYDMLGPGANLINSMSRYPEQAFDVNLPRMNQPYKVNPQAQLNELTAATRPALRETLNPAMRAQLLANVSKGQSEILSNAENTNNQIMNQFAQGNNAVAIQEAMARQAAGSMFTENVKKDKSMADQIRVLGLTNFGKVNAENRQFNRMVNIMNTPNFEYDPKTGTFKNNRKVTPIHPGLADMSIWGDNSTSSRRSGLGSYTKAELEAMKATNPQAYQMALTQMQTQRR